MDLRTVLAGENIRAATEDIRRTTELLRNVVTYVHTQELTLARRIEMAIEDGGYAKSGSFSFMDLDAATNELGVTHGCVEAMLRDINDLKRAIGCNSPAPVRVIPIREAAE